MTLSLSIKDMLQQRTIRESFQKLKVGVSTYIIVLVSKLKINPLIDGFCKPNISYCIHCIFLYRPITYDNSSSYKNEIQPKAIIF